MAKQVKKGWLWNSVTKKKKQKKQKKHGRKSGKSGGFKLKI